MERVPETGRLILRKPIANVTRSLIKLARRPNTGAITTKRSRPR